MKYDCTVQHGGTAEVCTLSELSSLPFSVLLLNFSMAAYLTHVLVIDCTLYRISSLTVSVCGDIK